MLYLLDTSALIAHHRQEPGWQKVQAIFDDDTSQTCIASLTLTEFSRRLKELGADEKTIARILGDYQILFSEIVPADTAVALAAFAVSNRTPRRLPLVDALIAASAQIRDACLVHRDEHMSAIPKNIVRQLRLQS